MADALDLSGETLARHAEQLETLDRLSQRFGQSLSGALAAGTSSGRELSSALDQVAGSLTSALGKSLGSATQSALTSALGSATQALSQSAISASFGGDLLPFAAGGVIGGGIVPFADGGVVSAPTYFPMAGGLGLAGERGSEAIMPLSRGPDGRLGVQGASGGSQNVTVNIAATDVDSFRRSEAQVSASLARAVSRGRRAL